jgi:hypothetical protein
MVIYFPISSKVISLEPETMSNTFLAPVILSFSNGESRAETIASLALFSPETKIP